MGRTFQICALLTLICCERVSLAEPAPPATIKRFEVSVCGTAIEAPVEFQPKPARQDQKGLMLVGPDVLVGVICLHKRESVAQSLTQFARSMIDEVTQSGQKAKLDPVSAPALQRSLGRPIVVADGKSTDGGAHMAIVWMESATAFYWVLYASPVKSWDKARSQRERIFASFKITDPLADRGPTEWWHPDIELDPRTLTEARSAFHTKVPRGRPPGDVFDGKPAPAPPAKIFERIEVRGPVGRLSAYVTPDPKDRKKRPAVIWAHGGFGGIAAEFWGSMPRSNDQTARAFRETGNVLAIGSWRAENDNPGDYELYYGEVDDFLAIAEHVRKLPYVDPERIYFAGHSSGATLVLLAAERTDRFRAAFAIGASPVFDDPDTYKRYGGVPFDADNATERLLRSSAPFVRSIRRPTFHFEGGGYSSVGIAQWMEHEARKADVPFRSFVALQADHFSILAPLTELIARKIAADTGPTGRISFTVKEIDALAVAAR
jgi:pimeloyl-ACP methyl ester carboxylesterase